MLHTTKSFEIGNMIYLECEFRNANGELNDPANSSYTIKDGRNILVATGGLKKRKDGLMYFVWTPFSTGNYTVQFHGTIDTREVTIRKKFRVIDSSKTYA